MTQPKTEDWLDSPQFTDLLWSLSKGKASHEDVKATIRSHTLDKQEVERAIGDDDIVNSRQDALNGNMAMARNNLRTELRQALKLTKGQE